MKPIYFSLVIILFGGDVWGKVKNGYSVGIASALTSLKMLNDLVAGEKNLSLQERREVGKRRSEIIDYVLYYELTEQLLTRFRTISPDIYEAIDNLKDAKGRQTDVYIRFISEKQAKIQARGITNISRMVDDAAGYYSEFGDFTVSVKVWVVEKSFFILAHELGHVKYQVDHLETYFEYYKIKYPPATTDPNNIGHAFGDPSGKTALTFEKIFRENIFWYKKGGRDIDSPVNLRERIAKQIRSSGTISLSIL